MTNIDISRLDESELRELNHRIVQRLRFLQQARAHYNMLEYNIGEKVQFQSPEGHTIRGMVSRFNRKTVTIITDDGSQWNVSPGFLHATDAKDNVITINPKV